VVDLGADFVSISEFVCMLRSISPTDHLNSLPAPNFGSIGTADTATNDMSGARRAQLLQGRDLGAAGWSKLENVEPSAARRNLEKERQSGVVKIDGRLRGEVH
jgi:hypothetical protein